MQLIKSLKQLINDNAPAFYITDASPELVKEIQSILGVTVTGIVDDRTKDALAKFKGERNLPYLASLGVQTAQALLENADKSSYLRLTRTQEKDSFGCFVLKLQYFKNGVAVDTLKVCSGQPNKQYFRKGVDSVSGSGEPLPEGRWVLGNIKWANGKDNYKASQGEGIGPASVPLTYDGPGRTSRSAIEMHIDWNRTAGAPGTIGCVGFFGANDYKKFVTWLRETDPRRLYVDWGLGSCPDPS